LFATGLHVSGDAPKGEDEGDDIAARFDHVLLRGRRPAPQSEIHASPRTAV